MTIIAIDKSPSLKNIINNNSASSYRGSQVMFQGKFSKGSDGGDTFSNGGSRDGSRLNYKAILNREFSLERDLSKYTRDNWGTRKWKMNMFGAGVKTPTKSPKVKRLPRSSNRE